MLPPRDSFSWVKLWPVIVTALTLTITAASANARLNELDSQVSYIYSNGSPVVAVRLAHIDERTDLMSKQLDRIEDKLDDIDTKKEARQSGLR